VEKIGLPQRLVAGLKLNHIVIYSQLPTTIGSWGKNQINAMVNLAKTYNASAYHVTGISLGGMGTFSALKYFPGFFKTAGICCGKTSTDNLEALLPTKIKAWHGIADPTIGISSIRSVIKGLNALGHDATLVEYNDDHAIWDQVYHPTSPDGYVAWLNGQEAPDAVTKQEVFEGKLRIYTISGKIYIIPVSL
jgi:predicted peptidase